MKNYKNIDNQNTISPRLNFKIEIIDEKVRLFAKYIYSNINIKLK